MQSVKPNLKRLMSCLAGSLARTSALQVNRLVFDREHVLDSGFSLRDLLASYDLELSSWKTWGTLPMWGERPLLATLPKWGMTQSGSLYALPILAHRIGGNAGSVLQWPTHTNAAPGWKNLEPLDKDGNLPAHPNQRFYDKATGRVLQKGLEQVVNMYPAPKATVQYWPTVKANEIHETVDQWRVRRAIPKNKMFGPSLSVAIQLWATPQARDYRIPDKPNSVRSQRKKVEGWSLNVNEQVGGGKLNPDWVEGLMGFPTGWTDINSPPRLDMSNTPLSQPAPPMLEKTG